MVEIKLEIISILKFRKCILNYKRNSGKMLIMIWLLMWLNERVVTLNATSQLLVLYIDIDEAKIFGQKCPQ